MNLLEEVPVHMRDKWQHIQERKGPADVDMRLEEIIPDLPPETLTPSQKGMREFHANSFIPKSKKKKDVSYFSQVSCQGGCG